MTNQLREYTVIVGDLIGSSKLSNRPQSSDIINSALLEVSREYSEEFHGPLVLTKGIDELSAVLHRPKAVYDICTALNEVIFPLRFRFAVVQNTLDIGIESRNAQKMDGRAFHIAADILAELKASGTYFGFQLLPPNDKFNLFLSQLANLASIIMCSRTEHQNQVLILYRTLNRQRDVGRQLGKTQQAVSDALNSAHWKALKRTEDVINGFLENMPRGEIQSSHRLGPPKTREERD